MASRRRRPDVRGCGRPVGPGGAGLPQRPAAERVAAGAALEQLQAVSRPAALARADLPLPQHGFADAGPEVTSAAQTGGAVGRAQTRVPDLTWTRPHRRRVNGLNMEHATFSTADTSCYLTGLWPPSSSSSSTLSSSAGSSCLHQTTGETPTRPRPERTRLRRKQEVKELRSRVMGGARRPVRRPRRHFLIIDARIPRFDLGL